MSNPLGIHCKGECTIHNPCQRCLEQIEAEASYREWQAAVVDQSEAEAWAAVRRDWENDMYRRIDEEDLP